MKTKYLLAILLVVGSLSILSANDVFAADFNYVVDSTGDSTDNDTGDGVCDDGAGNCTLRAAVQQGNANAGMSTDITFDASLNGSTITLTGLFVNLEQDINIIGPGAANLTIDFQEFSNFEFNDGSSGSGISGVTIEDVDEDSACIEINEDTITVSNNVIRDCGGEGIITIDDGGPTSFSGIVISGNTISSVGQGTGDSQGIDIQYVTNIVVSGNTITGATDTGIRMIAGVNGATVSGNNITMAGGSGTAISLQSSTGTLTIGGNSPANGNTISGSMTHGISIVGSATVKNNTVGGATNGITVNGDSNTVSSNTSDGNTYGITFYGDSNTVGDNTLQNNTSAALLFARSGSNIAENNTISGTNTFSNNVYNVAFAGLGVTGNKIEDGDISGATTADVYQLSTNSGDTNYLDNTTYSTSIVTTGTVDVNFDVRTYVTFAYSTPIASQAVVHKDSSTSTFSAFATTGGSGYTSYVSLDYALITSSGEDVTYYDFQAEGDYGLALIETQDVGSQNKTVDVTFLGGGDDDDDDDDDDFVVGDDDDDDDDSVGDDDDDDSVGDDDDDDDDDDNEEIIEEPTNVEPPKLPYSRIITQTVTPAPEPAPIIIEVPEPIVRDRVKIITEPVRLSQRCVVDLDSILKNVGTVQGQQLRVEIEDFFRESMKDYLEEYGKLIISVPAEEDGLEDKLVEIENEEDLDDVILIFKPLYLEEELKEMEEKREKEYEEAVLAAKEKDLPTPERKTVLEWDLDSDYDLDLVYDAIQALCKYKLFDPDTDKDGYLLSEEIFLGLDPLVFDNPPTVPAITNLDGKITGAYPSFRLRAPAGDKVKIVIYKERSNEQIVLGPVEIDEKNKGEIGTNGPLDPGNYYAVPQGENSGGKTIRFVVDHNVAIFTPIITEISKGSDKNHVIQEGDDESDLQVIRGKAEPGTVIYFTIKSTVFSSVAIADANGNFEIVVDRRIVDLEKEDHEIIVYSADEKKGLFSSILRYFTRRGF